MVMMKDEKPSPGQMAIAAAWLRKNDVDDVDGRACQKTADLLEEMIEQSKSVVRKRYRSNARTTA